METAPPSEEISRVTIIGAGTMGANIALNLASAGAAVCLTDISEQQLAAALVTVKANAAFLSANMLLREDVADVLRRIACETNLPTALAHAQLIIEAIPENLQMKLGLFAELDRSCAPEVIFASNTSTFLPSALASGLVHSPRATRLLVLHYWNPAHLIPLVEIVPHPRTDALVLAQVTRLVERGGKTAVVLRKETLGFIGNRLAFALQREAMDLVAKGVASPEEIDRVVKAGFGRRLPVTGVFGTADLGGLDVYLSICEHLYPDLCASSKAPADLQRLVATGRLGVKSGAGWKDYSPAEITALKDELAQELVLRAQLD